MSDYATECFDEQEGKDLVEFLEDDDFSPCCFCEHTYLSWCCQECPARDESMPTNPTECQCKKRKKA